MNLFQINEETNEVKINAPWIKLIPEFKALFTFAGLKHASLDRDELGRKRLTYIYFMLDFSSPIAEWELDKRHKEALTYTGLEERLITEVVHSAYKKYGQLQLEKCRALKSYKAALKGLDAMDEYFESVNFKQVDKMGKLLYTPNQYTSNVIGINKAYDELEKLKKRVQEEMSAGNSSIRGSATLGDREMKVNTFTSKANIVDGSEDEPDTVANWVQLEDIIKPKQE